MLERPTAAELEAASYRVLHEMAADRQVAAWFKRRLEADRDLPFSAHTVSLAHLIWEYDSRTSPAGQEETYEVRAHGILALAYQLRDEWRAYLDAARAAHRRGDQVQVPEPQRTDYGVPDAQREHAEALRALVPAVSHGRHLEVLAPTEAVSAVSPTEAWRTCLAEQSYRLEEKTRLRDAQLSHIREQERWERAIDAVRNTSSVWSERHIEHSTTTTTIR